ncbi:YibE/F family protein [Nocardiaceae bacterium YC2-7]|uniref:YibE/F family protein n=2 Tax=Antrihabitans stalactiti TaxID=2584121 RepID=A0A848KLG9_9NOCA|nr:YibE/F family protein [Antrihabitans stalactiti]
MTSQGHGHGHSHDGPVPLGRMARNIVVALLTGAGLLVLIGAVVLWPDRHDVAIPLPLQSPTGGAIQTEAGTVIEQAISSCSSPSLGAVFTGSPEKAPETPFKCQSSVVRIDSGPNEGAKTLLESQQDPGNTKEFVLGPGQPDLRVGEHVRLVRAVGQDGKTMYGFSDYSRGFPLTVVALVFLAVIAAVARWRGVRAVLGLIFAFVVLVVFLMPALLDGKPAIPVALVAGAAILFVVLYLAHGWNLRTSSALLGTLASMVVAAVLSYIAIRMTHVTGLSEDQNTNVQVYLGHVSVTGLLLAGFIIGSLGVLNDVTITQASTAFELAALDDGATRREIFTAAMRVGRDHIASTVYTLVFAYAGGALPLLLLFSVSGRSIREVLTSDGVAIEIARSSVGGVALALSVPLTTAIAVILARPLGGTEPAAKVSSSGRHSR